MTLLAPLALAFGLASAPPAQASTHVARTADVTHVTDVGRAAQAPASGLAPAVGAAAGDDIAADVALAKASTASVTSGYHDYHGLFEWRLSTFQAGPALYTHYSWSMTNALNVRRVHGDLDNAGWGTAFLCQFIPQPGGAACALAAKVWYETAKRTIEHAIATRSCVAVRWSTSVIYDKWYTVHCYR